MSKKAQDDVGDSGPRFSPPLYLQRYEYVQNYLFKTNPPIIKVADFGCAEGRFIRYLKKLPFAEEISAIDLEKQALDECVYKAEPIAWDFMFGRHRPMKLSLFEGSVIESDDRFKDLDAITCIELIEHLHQDVLDLFPKNVFGFMQPRFVIITTPNKEYNVLFPQLKETDFRHWDHKFEWTRKEFQAWCESVITEYPLYSYTLDGVGEPPIDRSALGHCSQIAIFTRQTIEKTSNIASLLINHKYKLFKFYNYPQRSAPAEEKLEFVNWDEVLA